MIGAILIAIGGVVLVVRIWSRIRRHRRAPGSTPAPTRTLDLHGAPLVASREIRERLRGRPFRVGSALILVAVAAAIVIPVLSRAPAAPARVGIVGGATPRLHATVEGTARRLGIEVRVTVEPSASVARALLASGHLDLVLLSDRALVVHSAIEPTDTFANAQFVQTLAEVLGIQAAYRAAGLSPEQIARIDTAAPVPILSLVSGTKNPNVGTSVIGVILVFLMLTQYNAWILLGVMEEKSSRVVEVLLATVRPLQLLAGKVLGIGLVALGQASVIVAFALCLAALVGSDLLHGTAPLEVASALLWLVLGYAFYCWVYAAAASMAERQDQVQSLALPLSLPILLGYVMSLTVASTGNPTLFFKVLAFLPPTAPFAMPVLVGLGEVSVLGFCASALISVVCTVAVARLAGLVYRRAILRTGARVKLRDVLRRAA
jgi:ABC-2 type transport system permease protein